MEMSILPKNTPQVGASISKAVGPLQITLTWQSVTTAAAVIAAVGGIAAAIAGIVRWMDKHKHRDEEIEALRNTHINDMAAVKKELALIIEGQLACLKGLQEQGCNGPVTAAVNKIETHLNERAHK